MMSLLKAFQWYLLENKLRHVTMVDKAFYKLVPVGVCSFITLWQYSMP